ncbi:hypothetical protein BHE74_00026280 [Ensete ventricosum]|nr:hypothetical protein GW17_00045935 [Ensete ventricosum]RWW66350.1 hypothetical protein BHE74_00026280 [Ensete ventricosum]
MGTKQRSTLPLRVYGDVGPQYELFRGEDEEDTAHSASTGNFRVTDRSSLKHIRERTSPDLAAKAVVYWEDFSNIDPSFAFANSSTEVERFLMAVTLEMVDLVTKDVATSCSAGKKKRKLEMRQIENIKRSHVIFAKRCPRQRSLAPTSLYLLWQGLLLWHISRGASAEAIARDARGWRSPWADASGGPLRRRNLLMGKKKQ